MPTKIKYFVVQDIPNSVSDAQRKETTKAHNFHKCCKKDKNKGEFSWWFYHRLNKNNPVQTFASELPDASFGQTLL